MASTDTETSKPIVEFRYQSPGRDERSKKIVALGRAGVLDLMVQIVAPGAANNLHKHLNVDEGFLVMKGRVRFYGPEQKVIGEYGPQEGVLIPAEVPYWFEPATDEPLEIMRIAAGHLGKKEQRVGLEKTPQWLKEEAAQLSKEHDYKPHS